MIYPKKPEFWIPHDHANLLTEADHERRHELAAMTLGHMLEDVASRTAEHVVELGHEGYLRVHDMRGDNEADSRQAGLLLLPYANGFEPAMKIRARTYQHYFPEDMRLLIVPNNTWRDKNYDLPTEDHPARSLSRKIMWAVTRLGIERVHLMGESQGATIGGHMLADGQDAFKIESASLKDPVDTVERTVKELQKDFQGEGLDGLRAFSQVLGHTGLRALTRTHHARGGIDGIPQAIGMARFGLGTQRGVNKRLLTTLTERWFAGNIAYSKLAREQDPHLQVVRYENSRVCTPQLIEDMEMLGILGHLFTVRFYGHEGTDHVILNAALNRHAMTGVKLS